MHPKYTFSPFRYDHRFKEKIPHQYHSAAVSAMYLQVGDSGPCCQQIHN